MTACLTLHFITWQLCKLLTTAIFMNVPGHLKCLSYVSEGVKDYFSQFRPNCDFIIFRLGKSWLCKTTYRNADEKMVPQDATSTTLRGTGFYLNIFFNEPYNKSHNSFLDVTHAFLPYALQHHSFSRMHHNYYCKFFLLDLYKFKLYFNRFLSFCKARKKEELTRRNT